MANNKSIQILRGSTEYDPTTSTEILLDGQPFYSKKDKSLHIGDGESLLQNIESLYNLLNGYGKGSTQLKWSEAHGEYSTAFNVGETHGRYSFAVGSGSIAGWTEDEFNEKFPNGVDASNNPITETRGSTEWLVRVDKGEIYTYSIEEYSYGEAILKTKEFRAFSIALGQESFAKNKNAIAIGRSAKAYGQQSVAFNGGTAQGYRSFAMGASQANGDYSTVFGATNIVDSYGGLATGLNHTIDSKSTGAVAFGINNTIKKAIGSIAVGSRNEIAFGEASIAVGCGNYLYSNFGITIGRENKSHNTGDISIGSFNLSDGGNSSVSLGYHNTSKGVAIGRYSKALHYNSVAIGESCIAKTTGSVALGLNNQANGSNSFAIGGESIANGGGSFAGGNGNCTADGYSSFAFGYACKALKDNTIAIGNNVSASSTNKLVCGYYNTDELGTVFEIGNGNSNTRSNALTVYKDGRCSVLSEPVNNIDIVRKGDIEKVLLLPQTIQYPCRSKGKKYTYTVPIEGNASGTTHYGEPTLPDVRAEAYLSSEVYCLNIYDDGSLYMYAWHSYITIPETNSSSIEFDSEFAVGNCLSPLNTGVLSKPYIDTYLPYEWNEIRLTYYYVRSYTEVIHEEFNSSPILGTDGLYDYSYTGMANATIEVYIADDDSLPLGSGFDLRYREGVTMPTDNIPSRLVYEDLVTANLPTKFPFIQI